MLYSIAFIVLLLLLSSCSGPTQTHALNEENSPKTLAVNSLKPDSRVIYGEDDRLDLYAIENPILYSMAKSTAVLIDKSQLISEGDHYDTMTATYKDRLYLCPSERFGHQWATGFCSGFLVDENLLVTAGHCVQSQMNCDNTSFVFDFYTTDEQDPGPKKLAKTNVYSCKKLIKSFAKGDGADYAIIELDRKVKDRPALAMRTEGQAEVNDPLVVIGYPFGLPVKIAAGSNIRSQANGYFVANLDTYGGNSGSAVFNSLTGLVEGILARGEDDYVFKDGCRVSNVCENDKCRGEDVTHITEVYSSLNKQTQQKLQGRSPRP